jgi:competence ComEA-like helix-hairpin-helix protein
MRVSEGQRLGAVLFIIASLVLYGISLFRHQRPIAPLHLPWGEQTPGTVAVEIEAGEKGDGIYFASSSEGLSPVLSKTGLLEKIETSDLFPKPLPEDFAISLTIDRGVIKLSDMPVVKRLALGLTINLNSASMRELSMVPGIGESTAAQIIALRQSNGKFQTLSDLKKVPGIKDYRLRSLSKYLHVSGLR